MAEALELGKAMGALVAFFVGLAIAITAIVKATRKQLKQAIDPISAELTDDASRAGDTIRKRIAGLENGLRNMQTRMSAMEVAQANGQLVTQKRLDTIEESQTADRNTFARRMDALQESVTDVSRRIQSLNDNIMKLIMEGR